MKAIWNDTVIAEAKDTKVVEGNHYFPPSALKQEFFEDSETTTICGWKGLANYYHVKVDGQLNRDAAWYYTTPKAAAEEIRGYVAFWKGVEVV